jgi:hypothetical protein
MIVYCNFALANQVTPKQIMLFEFVSGMLYHFQNLSFGAGVKEITYYTVGSDPSHVSFYKPGISYSSKTKTIGSLFTVDYETVLSLEGALLFDFVSQQVINESKRFVNKKIKDFSLEGYIQSLEDYFAHAKILMSEGNIPGKDKILNEDIQLAIAKKWSRL